MYEEGLWSRKDALTFIDSDINSSSHIGGVSTEYSDETEANRKVNINVNSIDNIAYDKEPTFIKMDIEGAELEALKGAQKTIRQYKPKLAICIYHKRTDLIDIPLYIKEMVPEYKIYVRHHSYFSSETVLYAVI